MAFVRKTNAFVRHATWLDKDLHGPALEVLLYCATELDAGRGTTTTVTAYRQAWSALMADKPKDDAVATDDVDSLIEGLGK